MVRKIMLVAALALVFAGCDSFNKAFVESWEKSFVEACAPDGSPAEQTEICSCVAKKAVTELTVAQLSDVKFSTKWVEETGIPACTPQ